MYVSQSMLPVDIGSTSKSNGTPVKIEQRRCAVCKDIASGYHYGVWSCEGCKAFFKRSIQGPCDYICPATNSCTIDKHRRKSCQACRLRTCYEVGMSKGGTRRERRPYRRKCSSTTNPGESQSPNVGIYHPMYKMNIGDDNTLKLDRSEMDSPSSNSLMAEPSNETDGNLMTTNVDHIRAADYIQILVNLEYNPSTVGMTCVSPNTDLDSLEGVMKALSILFDKELVFLINWAKCIPNYTNLLIEDQIRLIECGWLEVLILNCIRHSIPLKGAKIFFAQDLILDRELLRCISLVDLADGFLSLIHHFYVLDISVAQFSALKAVCFLNSTNRTLDSGAILQQLRSTAIKCLQYVCNTSTSGERVIQNKEEQLLLLLPHIKALSNRLMMYLVRMKEMHVITSGDLLHEMLDAQEGILLDGITLGGNSDSAAVVTKTEKCNEEITDYFEEKLVPGESKELNIDASLTNQSVNTIEGVERNQPNLEVVPDYDYVEFANIPSR